VKGEPIVVVCIFELELLGLLEFCVQLSYLVPPNIVLESNDYLQSQSGGFVDQVVEVLC